LGSSGSAGRRRAGPEARGGRRQGRKKHGASSAEEWGQVNTGGAGELRGGGGGNTRADEGQPIRKKGLVSKRGDIHVPVDRRRLFSRRNSGTCKIKQVLQK